MLNINRINELAKKSREIGLTLEEKEEQRLLRRQYIDSCTGSLKAQLDNTCIIDENGNKISLKDKK